MPPWYEYPDYGFGLVLLAGLALRDRWLATAASLLLLDWAACDWVTSHVPAQWAWAYKAVIDLSVAIGLAWSGSLRGIVLSGLLGVSVSFYILIGAAWAFGSAYAQTRVNYYAWWSMLYLAFAICGFLVLGGLDNHGGKQIRLGLAGHIRNARRAVLESYRAYRSAEDSRLESGARGELV